MKFCHKCNAELNAWEAVNLENECGPCFHQKECDKIDKEYQEARKLLPDNFFDPCYEDV